MDRLTPVVFTRCVGLARLHRQPPGARHPEPRARVRAVDGCPRGGPVRHRPRGRTRPRRGRRGRPGGRARRGVRRAVRPPAALPAQGARPGPGDLDPGPPDRRAGHARVRATTRRRRSTSTTGPSPSCSSPSHRSRCSSACAPTPRWPTSRPGCGVPRLTDHRRVGARVADDPAHALLAGVLATPADEAADFAREVVAACVRLEAARRRARATPAAAVVRVAEEHPDDIGLVVLLLMHHRVLQPGEYIDVAAGVLHSYVRGLGIEVLANSDNVVRAGLTSKEVNVPELLRIVDPRADGVAGRGRVVEPGARGLRQRLRPVPAPPGHARARPARRALAPRIVFCLRGRVTLTAASGTLELGDVESAFLPAGEGAVDLEGVGEVYVVTVPQRLTTDEEAPAARAAGASCVGRRPSRVRPSWSPRRCARSRRSWRAARRPSRRRAHPWCRTRPRAWWPR